MTDIGSVQVLTNAVPGGPAQTNDAPNSRARAESEGRLQANSRSVAFTAKFSGADGEPGLRIVRGEEVAAVESANLTALLDIRLSQAAARALISLQEVENSGDAPAATDTEATETASAQADSEGAGDTTASLDVEAPTTGGADIQPQGTGDNTAAAQDTGLDTPAPTEGVGGAGGDAPNIEVTLPDGTVSAGGTGGPPRGAVLDIVV